MDGPALSSWPDGSQARPWGAENGTPAGKLAHRSSDEGQKLGPPTAASPCAQTTGHRDTKPFVPPSLK